MLTGTECRLTPNDSKVGTANDCLLISLRTSSVLIQNVTDTFFQHQIRENVTFFLFMYKVITDKR